MKIHYISPYSLTKNIGGAINDAIKQLNASPDDWVIHVDQDACFLLPDTKKQIEEILAQTEYDILGPGTNRLSMEHQLVTGVFDEFDIRRHAEIALRLQNESYGQVLPTRDILAAFCLCFRVEMWEKLGGFQQNSIQFDSIFCASAMNSGAKFGIMVGAYVFHCYRLLSDNPKYSVSHLLLEPPQVD